MNVKDIVKHVATDQAKLVEARIQLLHAVQTIPSVGRAFLEHKKDDSHTNMGWDIKEQAFVGHMVRAENHSVQIGVCVSNPAVLFYHHGDESIDRLALDGVKLKNVHTWLGENLTESGLDTSKISWKPGFEIPSHGVLDSDEAFSFSSLAAATAALAAWFGNSFEFMRVVGERESFNEPRCWPHHFDVGIVKGYGKNDTDEELWIGIGLSPGDENYPMPYYYTSPYPGGQAATLPALACGGKWHTDGFISAVLHAADIIEAQDQCRLVAAYLEESIAACKNRLGLAEGDQ